LDQILWIKFFGSNLAIPRSLLLTCFCPLFWISCHAAMLQSILLVAEGLGNIAAQQRGFANSSLGVKKMTTPKGDLPMIDV
jgi:hypothetical protein